MTHDIFPRRASRPDGFLFALVGRWAHGFRGFAVEIRAVCGNSADLMNRIFGTGTRCMG